MDIMTIIQTLSLLKNDISNINRYFCSYNAILHEQDKQAVDGKGIKQT
jgi:serine/threonine-protein kinase RIO1